MDTGRKHWRSGATLPAATKKLLSEQKLGEKHPKFKGYYITPAGTFSNLRAAAKANGKTTYMVAIMCKDKYFMVSGWAFQEKDGPDVTRKTEYQRYLFNKNSGAFTEWRKDAHYMIYQFLQQGFKVKEAGGNVSKGPVIRKVGVTPLENYPKVLFAHHAEPSVSGDSSFITIIRDHVNGNRVVTSGEETEKTTVESERVLHPPFGTNAPPKESRPGTTYPHPFGIFYRAAVLPALNTNYKLPECTCIENSNGAKVEFRTAVLFHHLYTKK